MTKCLAAVVKMTKCLAAVVIGSSILLFANARGEPTLQSGLECKQGPVTKTYGGTSWLIYGCSDAHSLSLITAPGSAASPFVFFFEWKADGYHLAGVGTGNKSMTDAAFKEISVFSQVDIEALFEETKRH